MSYSLRYVARNLRYLPLPDLIGNTIVLRSLKTASNDLIRQISPELPSLKTTPVHDEHHIETQPCQARILGFRLASGGGGALEPRDQGITITFATWLFHDRRRSKRVEGIRGRLRSL